jgi:hypothetical protein
MDKQSWNIAYDKDNIAQYRANVEKDLSDNIRNVIVRAQALPSFKNTDFYIVMLMEPATLGTPPRTYVKALSYCPRPEQQQTVWKYHYKTEGLEFLWSIPNRLQYYQIVANPQEYLSKGETAALAKTVLLMESGELWQWVLRENENLHKEI